MKTTRWASTDKAAIDLITTWMSETKPRTSLGDLVQLLGGSYSSLRNRFDYQNSPLTLGEFAKVCEYFGKGYANSYLQTLEMAAAADKDSAKSAKLRAEIQGNLLSEQIIKIAVNHTLNQDTSKNTVKEQKPLRRHQGK